MPIRLLRTDTFDRFDFIEVSQSDLIASQTADHGDARSFDYAILSHRWRAEEIIYTDRLDVSSAREKAGWRKLDDFRQLAQKDGYKYMWTDTCCIDKASATELGEALSSMYKWYELAGRCYAYLDDVHGENQASFDGDHAQSAHVSQRQHWKTLFNSQWFTRGWTLQEMIAPRALAFYSAEWQDIGTLDHWATLVATRTGVDQALLTGKRELRSYSIAQRMSWAAGRETTRPEDRAYSLLGLLDVNMPILYGEGSHAFRRLQEELVRSSDMTLFAWRTSGGAESAGLFAASPDDFKGCNSIVPLPSGTLQLVGNRVLFRTYLWQAADRAKDYQAVIAYYENAPATVIALNLKSSTNDTYTVRTVPSRLADEDIFFSEWTSREQEFTVWHASSDAILRHQENAQLVLCRCVPDEFGKVKCLIRSAEPRDMWDEKGQYFMVSPDSRDQRRTELTAVLQIQSGNAPPTPFPIRILLGRSSFRQRYISGQVNQLGLLESIRLRYHNTRYYNYQLVFASMHRRKVMHLSSDIVEIQALSLWAVFVQLASVSLSTVFRIFLQSFAIAPITLTVLLPLFTIYLARLKVMPNEWDDSTDYLARIDRSELGVLVCCTVIGGPLFIFWILRVAIIVEESTPAWKYWDEVRYSYHCMVRVLRPAYILVVNILSIIFCALYATAQRPLQYELRRLGFFDDQKYDSLSSGSSGITAPWAHVGLVMIVLFARMRNIDIFRVIINLGLVVPLLIVVDNNTPYSAPWLSADCQNIGTTTNVPGVVKEFWIRFANGTSRTPTQVCYEFSQVSKYLWTAVSLSLVEAFFALLTAPLAQPQLTLWSAMRSLYRYARSCYLDSTTKLRFDSNAATPLAKGQLLHIATKEHD